MGLKPEFSAKAMGTASRESAKAFIAYCSSPGLYDLEEGIKSAHQFEESLVRGC